MGVRSNRLATSSFEAPDAQRGQTDRQRGLQQRSRHCKVAVVAVQQPQIVHDRCGPGVVGPTGLLGQIEGAFEQDARRVEQRQRAGTEARQPIQQVACV